ncbi:MAG: hypothetical protein V3T88_01700 [Nitrosomonadaceae bacterium]
MAYSTGQYTIAEIEAMASGSIPIPDDLDVQDCVETCRHGE